MVKANVKIIGGLKAFLETVVSDADIRQLVTVRKEDFSRDRKLPLEKVVGLLINFLKRSLSVEVKEFFDILGQSEMDCTKGAFSLQRVKLKPLFFKVWNQFLVSGFYEHYGKKVKRWKGFRLMAMDGSTAYLFNKKEVIEHFGTQDNQHTRIPMARIMQIRDVLNQMTICGEIYPIKQSEQQIAAEKVECFPPDSLGLFDRGYPSYALMYLLMNQEEGRHFVMRCKTTFNKEVRDFIRSRKHSKIVELRPNKAAIEQLRRLGYIITDETVIKVRMVKIKLPNGEIEILLTNLYDEKEYTLQDLKELYAIRWQIETTYGHQKNQQQMEIFSGQTVISIAQDYHATVFVSNLQSLIEKQCERYVQQVSQRRKYNYKINKNVSWAMMKNEIVKLFLCNNEQEILLKLQKAFERNLEPERPNRQYKRVRKARRLNGKYQTMTNYKRAI